MKAKRARVFLDTTTKEFQQIFFPFVFQHHTVVNSGCLSGSPIQDETELDGDLTTINLDVLSRLHKEEQQLETSISACQAMIASTQNVGEELISTCVTQAKIKTVQQTPASETE